MSDARLIPSDIADRMIDLSRREALWRGMLIGSACTLAAAFAAFLIL